MDKTEELMSYFPNLSYILDDKMPEGQSGFYVDNYIYLNPRQTKESLTNTVSEEIGHYLTSVGDITAQNTNEKRKQERKARDIGATLAVTPYDLIDCFEDGCKTITECAVFLGVLEETIHNAVKYYARKYDGIKTENNYTLFFHADGTIGVRKMF
ncbi:ImmA/IrrE family metallo-endopeptidase [Tetragenococcus halophilus]|uniref:ImmA/IrrE family metallo-endopeptidase n=1 Tax=Tetragenococcus halophilus TaxID=51669 RepID=UPI00209AB7C4|nr:ImmA/IrrE family metallo-endopeptidase [Tetragenococcus halophilus]MCO8292620.1 ImmA/IrrE family metallo-endopeptidase [Tetragenococcus halophilus]